MKWITNLYFVIFFTVLTSSSFAQDAENHQDLRIIQNSWLVDFGISQSIAPGGSLMIPSQAQIVDRCFNLLVANMPIHSRYYLASFGGPYLTEENMQVFEVYFFRSEYLFYNYEPELSFDSFLELTPRYICSQHMGELALGELDGAEIQWLQH